MSKIKFYTLAGLIMVILLFLVFFNNSNNSEETDLAYSAPECENILFSGPKDSKINILFIPNNYDDKEKFINDVKKYQTLFFSLVPFKGNEDKFNFIALNDFDQDYECSYDEAILCDNGKVKRSASKCFNDYIIVITDVNGVTNIFDRLRSAAWQGVATLNNKDELYVFPHEFAHLFSSLADEYIIPGATISWDAPNCVSDSSCQSFKILENTGCYKGCMDIDYYREPFNGIMKDYYSLDGRTFGKYNEYVIANDINLMANQESSNIKLNSPEDIYIIDASYKDGQIIVDSVSKDIGFSPRYNKGGYSLQLGEKIINIPNPAIKFEDGYSGEKLEGNTEILDSSKFTVIVNARDVGNIDYGKFLDDNQKEVGAIKFSNSFLTHTLSKQVVNINV